MTGMRLLIFMLFGLILMPFTAYADDGNWCNPTEPPVINIRTSTNQISYDFSQSKKQLDRFEVSTINPYASNVITDVGGLMKGGIETQQKMLFDTRINPNTRQVCYWHNVIDFSLHIKPQIYIANDFPRGSCMHNAIVEHELKHVIVDREIVNKYAVLIGQALKDDVTRYRVYGPVPVSQKNALETQLKQRMHRIISRYTSQMTAERRKRQQQIDSLPEYERVNHMCPKQK